MGKRGATYELVVNGRVQRVYPTKHMAEGAAAYLRKQRRADGGKLWDSVRVRKAKG